MIYKFDRLVNIFKERLVHIRDENQKTKPHYSDIRAKKKFANDI